jgi:hypothetical protein
LCSNDATRAEEREGGERERERYRGWRRELREREREKEREIEKERERERERDGGRRREGRESVITIEAKMAFWVISRNRVVMGGIKSYCIPICARNRL